MKKIRDLYAETQQNANSDFSKVTLDRVKKIQTYINKEYQSIILKNEDFSNLEEIVFYRDKFKQVEDAFALAASRGDKRPALQERVQEILKEQFQMQGGSPTPVTSSVPPKLPEPAIKINQSGKSNEGAGQRSKQITSFFENKRNEVQKSRIGFKSILQERPSTLKKYPVKSSQIKVQNNESIMRIQKEMQNLKNAMNSKLHQKDQQAQQIHQQNQQFYRQIKAMQQQIQNLKRENELLKQKTHKSQVSYSEPPVYQQIDPQQQSGLYKIKYKFNNLGILKQKNDALSRQKSVKSQKVKNVPFHQDMPERIEERLNKSISMSEDLQIIKQLNIQPMQNRIKAPSSNLKFDQEQVEDEGRNIAVRSKINFFKSSVVIYRGQTCEVAIKIFELVNHQRRKLIIYVNNKQEVDQKINIAYKVDPSYYRLQVLKKLEHIDFGRQGRQQIQVTLVNQYDLDSVIQGRLTVNSVQINFLVPAMFIQFSDKRPPMQKTVALQKYTVKAIYQFSTIHAAQQLIAFDKEYGYGATQDAARIYGISKYQQGYIFLRWKKVGIVEVETIRPWKLFLSYLLCRDF